MGQCFACPSTGSVAIIEQFGKFNRVAHPGCNILIPCFGECVAGKVSMRVQEVRLRCETKTLDNVFVSIQVSVQYKVVEEKIHSAFYRLTNTKQQIEAYVFDVIRSAVPRLSLDDVFTNKEQIATSIKTELGESMGEFGYSILATPVTDIDPANDVKHAMNEINRQSRLRVAAEAEGEGARILAMKKAQAVADTTRIQAEAEAEAMFLSGSGVARQRRAIIQGMRDDVKEFADEVGSVNAATVMETMLLVQYFDLMKSIGNDSKNNTLFLHNGPGAVESASNQIRAGFKSADQVH